MYVFLKTTIIRNCSEHQLHFFIELILVRIDSLEHEKHYSRKKEEKNSIFLFFF